MMSGDSRFANAALRGLVVNVNVEPFAPAAP